VSSERITIIPPSYPALECETYRASEDEHDRTTELPPEPVAVVWQTVSALAHKTLVKLPWGLK
jgi:hypothetical protein